MLRIVARTERQRRGAANEAIAARHLAGLGWEIVARNMRVARDEIDILAVDPGPPATLVAVEVRSAESSLFGAPEERLDRAKAAHLYRALFTATAVIAELNPGVRGLRRRIDLVVVDRRNGALQVRHLRGLEPPD